MNYLCPKCCRNAEEHQIGRYPIAGNSSGNAQYEAIRQSVFKDLAPENQMPQRFSQKSGAKIGPSSSERILKMLFFLGYCQK
jgi:hypothetical protein